MTRLADQRSILGIDPASSRGLAFGFFENGSLLDWGIRQADRNHIAVLDRLVTSYKADVVVLEDPDAVRCERRLRARRLLRAMAEHLEKTGIAVVMVGRYDVRRTASHRGKGTKHEVALEIARMFPEVEHLIPPPRKSFDSEHGRSNIFDAISLVLHVLGTEKGSHGDVGRQAQPPSAA